MLHVGAYLYITRAGIRLSREGLAVVVTDTTCQPMRILMRVPLRHLEGIACFGANTITPQLMQIALEMGVSICYFSARGRLLGRVEAFPRGSTSLRKEQYRAHDDPKRAYQLAASFVSGKLANARHLLRRAARDHAAGTEAGSVCEDAADRLSRLCRQDAQGDLDVLRGIEGAGAAAYFGAFDAMIKHPAPEFRFHTRTRRPPKDRVNAMLSFGYTLLMHDVAAAVAGVGLDPSLGFLHAERAGTLSLALDLMEELRHPVVDRLVLSLLNRGQIKPEHFEPLQETFYTHTDTQTDTQTNTQTETRTETGWYLNDAGRAVFLDAYQRNKHTPIQHRELAYHITWGTVPHWQAQLFARAVREGTEYTPFVVK